MNEQVHPNPDQTNETERFFWDLDTGEAFPESLCRTQEIWVTPYQNIGEKVTDTFTGAPLTLIRDTQNGEFFFPDACICDEVWITPNMRTGVPHDLLAAPRS